MNNVLVLCAICACVAAIPTSVFRDASSELYKIQDFTQPIQMTKTVSSDDVLLYFRNQNDLDNENALNISDTSSLQNLGFSTEKFTIFLIHGWRNEYDSDINNVLTEAYLSKHDVNVFVVDWSSLADDLYINAASAVGGVGEIVGKYVQSLVKNNNLDLDRTAIAGHSLGAHVAGIVGLALGGKIDYIVGLDPALPLFLMVHEDYRLDVTDAKFVQVIHTCSGFLGIYFNIGHSDYYPNGGREQPGCWLDVLGTCAHGRSFKYFAESIKSGGFIARKCESYDDFESNDCSEEYSDMGGYYIDKR
ncbi:pancreatic lipase-related protein 2-like [Diabrotica undecimpunctata]|uniref:pancreatic lipase-related protein 2-like n=1 Tax=Diabrotica undecimpunctata TaxID=50387 RepID=UPI003B63687B